MRLPKGWRKGVLGLLLPLIVILAVIAYAFLLHLWLLSWEVDERAVMMYLLTEACAAVVVAMYIVSISMNVRGKAWRVHRRGVERTARAVAAFLEGRGIGRAEARRPHTWRGEGTSIEVLAFDPVLTWVLVGPLPRGDDPSFNELLAGLGGVLDGKMGPQREG